MRKSADLITEKTTMACEPHLAFGQWIVMIVYEVI